MRYRVLAALAVATVVAPLCASSATAAPPVALSPMHFMKVNHGNRPGGGSSSLLAYQGGQVETTPSVYLDFWGGWWNSGATTGTNGTFTYTSTDAMTYLQDFFGSVGGSSWVNTTAQYCQGIKVGSTSCTTGGTPIANLANQLKGFWVDASSTVPNRVTQADIAAEAVNAAGHFQLPSQSQAGATIIVLTPSGDSMRGFGTSWCAWHSVTSYSNNNLAYAYVPYQPDAGSACGENFVNSTDDSFGNGYFDGFSIVGGHEYAEAQTDPHPSSGAYGWIDSSGSEIGDKCAWASSSANITLGANEFAVQPLWSNAKNGCVMSS